VKQRREAAGVAPLSLLALFPSSRCAAGSMDPLGSEVRNRCIAIPTIDWQPRTRSVKIDGLNFDVVSDSLHWPTVPGHGLAVRGDIKMRIVDQGRFFGKRGALGRGIKLDNASAGVVGGDRLLYFVIVAKGQSCSDDVLYRLYDRLRKMGVGSGRYETIQDDSHVCVYDVEASPAYAINTGKVGTKRFLPNVRIEMPQSRESFLAWFVARAPIASGSHLWAAYGADSVHHTMIRKAIQHSESRAPKVNQKRAELSSQLQKARLVKRMKKTPVKPSVRSRVFVHSDSLS
jgi:hypothetical protein